MLAFFLSLPSNWFTVLGFNATGIPRQRTTLGAATQEKLDVALSRLSTLRRSKQPNDAAPLIDNLELFAVELGEVPFLANGGLRPNTLWISTCTMRNNNPETLENLIAHELGHAMNLQRKRSCLTTLMPGTWVLAIPIVGLLLWLDMPLLIVPAALIHAMLWLKHRHSGSMKAEARADRWAAALMGEQAYAEALAGSLVQHYGMRRDVLRDRLKNMGLDAEHVRQLLEKHYEDKSSD
jgi:Zn-dependent protease with chaperone function